MDGFIVVLFGLLFFKMRYWRLLLVVIMFFLFLFYGKWVMNGFLLELLDMVVFFFVCELFFWLLEYVISLSVMSVVRKDLNGILRF